MMTTTSDLSKLRDMFPTHAWRRRSADGDSRFNEGNIAATETALSEFLLTLFAAAGSRESILDVVKDVVIALNHLGGIEGALGNFIETQEREELCQFIGRAARIAGLDAEATVDITEEWREW